MATSLVSTGVTFPDSTTQSTAATGFGFKNRIINGAMMIDQRNAGASVAAVSSGNLYPVDRLFIYNSNATSRFSAQQNAGGVTPPSGFINYLGMTTTSAYTPTGSDEFVVGQRVEGFNVSDLGWGAAGAQAVTLSFWVRSSLTGMFGVSIRNGNGTRSYPASYTINAANTWEYKTITVPGDTSGTWLTNNGVGLSVTFGLGVGATASGAANTWASSNYPGVTGATSVVGTNGATFYITGVQLEKGSTATQYDYRPYGTELQLCQRYYETSFPIGIAPVQNIGAIQGRSAYAGSSNGSSIFANTGFIVSKRASPTMTYYNPTAANANFDNGGSVVANNTDATGFGIYTTTLTGSRSFVNWSASSEL